MDGVAQARHRGRPKGTGQGLEKFQVSLDPSDAEWGKAQPEGLSKILRRLLRAERQREEKRSGAERAA